VVVIEICHAAAKHISAVRDVALEVDLPPETLTCFPLLFFRHSSYLDPCVNKTVSR